MNEFEDEVVEPTEVPISSLMNVSTDVYNDEDTVMVGYKRVCNEELR